MLTSDTPRPASEPQAAAPSSLTSGPPSQTKKGLMGFLGPQTSKGSAIYLGPDPKPARAEGGPFSSLSQPGTQTPPCPGAHPPAPP